jgi:hypothetical protein
MIIISPVLFVSLLAVLASPETSASGPGDADEGKTTPRTRTVETLPMAIDRIYPSMTGPYELVEVDTSDMDWVTAIRTEVVDEADGASMGGEFFCHSQLQLHSGLRLMVNATGTEEIRLPPGFGIPVGQILAGIPSAVRSVRFLGMVLNNHFPAIDRQARIRATIEYVREKDLGSSPALRKLYPFHISMRVEDLALYEPPADGPQPHEDVTTHCALVGGQETHWLVPPGRQKPRRRFTGLVPIQSTVHHIATHVHNHGEYVRLSDVTEGRVLWQANVEYESGRRQIRNIPVYSSVDGLRVYPDHEYEIEALYDNTMDVDVDAMAMMYLYFNPEGDRALLLPGTGKAP